MFSIAVQHLQSTFGHCGLSRGFDDVNTFLEVALLNSYFVYDRQVYIQSQGFFMGVRPAPIGAIIKMWRLERNSIYTDRRLRYAFYGQFYDDLGVIIPNKRRAQMLCTAIENEDPDKLIKSTVDYPKNSDDFVPFLNVEVKIERDGMVSTRLFRKPQKTLLTLNSNSHHSNSIKEHTQKKTIISEENNNFIRISYT